MEVYFDNSATTRPYDEVIDEMSMAMKKFYGNPSSLHSIGVSCDKQLTDAREFIASTINCTKEEIFFTSGASESNNLFLKGLTKSGNHIIISKFEHPSILKTAQYLEENGIEVTYLDVDANGQIDSD